MESIIPFEAVVVLAFWLNWRSLQPKLEEANIEFISYIRSIHCVQQPSRPEMKRNHNELLNFRYRIENVRYISQWSVCGAGKQTSDCIVAIFRRSIRVTLFIHHSGDGMGVQ